MREESLFKRIILTLFNCFEHLDIFVTSIFKSAVTESRFNDPLAGTSAFHFFEVSSNQSSYLKLFWTHSVLSSYLLIKHISSAIMGWLLYFGPKEKDFGIAHRTTFEKCAIGRFL